nr:immunoglobulin heavy chain junction region [Homo sapiens]
EPVLPEAELCDRRR